MLNVLWYVHGCIAIMILMDNDHLHNSKFLLIAIPLTQYDTSMYCIMVITLICRCHVNGYNSMSAYLFNSFNKKAS